MQDEWKAGSDESDDSGDDSSEVETESAPAHKETVTVPTTTITTTTTPALPLEALGLQPAVATPRRVEPLEVKKVTRSATTTPPADATASTHENVGQVDGPAKSTDTTLKVTPSTSGTAGKKKKRGRPKKNPPKKKTDTSTKTDATAETPQQAPEVTPQETPQVVNETTPQKEEYDDPVIPEPSSPPPPPDMVVAKVGQYSAEEIVKTPTKRRAADPAVPHVGEPLPKTPTGRPAFTPKETPLVALNPKKKAKKDRKGKEKEKETPVRSYKEPTQAEKMQYDNEERRTQAIESLLSKWTEPSKTATPAPQDIDDDGMWGQLLVNRVKKIKDQEVKEDFKQHLNVLALQAARGTWRLSPAKGYVASPKMAMARPAFMPQSPRLMGSKQFTDASATTQTRAPHGPAGDFAGWTNARGQQMATQMPAQMAASAQMSSQPMPGPMQTALAGQMPSPMNPMATAMPMQTSMQAPLQPMTDEEWRANYSYMLPM